MKRRIFYLFFTLLFINSCSEPIREPHSLKFENKTFENIAQAILNQNEVYQMDDFSRYYKSVNDVPVKIRKNEGNQDAQFLEIVEDSLKIEGKIVSHLRIKLEETKLREFTKSNDTILFKVDGFLNGSWGFMYCNKGLEMDSEEFKFKKNTVKFVEEINENWKKVAAN